MASLCALVCLGRKPRSVLEITEFGQGRFDRIYRLMQSCRVSIHDISRTGLPVRFNMPFELGLACGLRRHDGRHLYLILERQPHVLPRHLSDLKEIDPLVHDGKPRVLISCLLSALGAEHGNPSPPDVYAIWRQLMRVSREIKSHFARADVYARGPYLRLVAAAAQLAVNANLISR